LSQTVRGRASAWCALACALALGGCRGKEQSQAPRPDVLVAHVRQADVPIYHQWIEAEGQFRTEARNIGQFYVRNSRGHMVPLSALLNIQDTTGPEFTMRYNLYRCAQINALPAPEYSTAQGVAAPEQVFAQTMPPPEMGSENSVAELRVKHSRLAGIRGSLPP